MGRFDPTESYVLVLVDMMGASRMSLEEAAALHFAGEDHFAGWRMQPPVADPREVVLAPQWGWGDQAVAAFRQGEAVDTFLRGWRAVARPWGAFRFAVVRGWLDSAPAEIASRGRHQSPTGPISIVERVDGRAVRHRLVGSALVGAGGAILALKRERRHACWEIGSPAEDRLLTTLSELERALVGRMSAFQFRVFRELESRLVQGRRIRGAQAAIARQFGVPPQSVSRALREGGAPAALAGAEQIRRLLRPAAQAWTGLAEPAAAAGMRAK